MLTADIGRIGDLGMAHGGFMSVAAVSKLIMALHHDATITVTVTITSQQV